MSPRGGRPGLLRSLGRAVTIAAQGFACCCLLVAGDGCVERVKPADAIVVLASLVKPHDVVSARLEARLGRGLALWRARVAPVVIVSGGVTRQGIDEAAVMRDWLVRHGVPDSAIVVDSRGRNTWETARFVSGWLRGHGGTRVVAVSQYFHLTRTRLALRRFGVAWVGTARPVFAEWRDLYSLPRDTWGLFVYALRKDPRKEGS